MHYLIAVDNVKCGGCVATIQNALQEIEGVQSVSVDVDSGNVNLQVDTIPRETLTSILASLGYPEKASA
jgi:copper chaperone CopZ